MLSWPRAGPINETAPIENETGKDVHNKYSNGELTD